MFLVIFVIYIIKITIIIVIIIIATIIIIGFVFVIWQNVAQIGGRFFLGDSGNARWKMFFLWMSSLIGRSIQTIINLPRS